MEKISISLKKNCSERFSKQLIPSPKDQVYSIQDFTSPDFLDRLLISHTLPIRSNTEPHFSSSSLLSFIDFITHKIDKLKLLVDDLKEAYIVRAVVFCGEENKEYEVENIRREMKKCYAKIIQHNYNPLLVERFVQLFDYYKKLNEKEQLFMTDESLDDFVSYFNEKIESIVENCSKVVKDELPMPHMVVIEQKNSIKPRIISHIQDRVISMHQRKIFDIDAKHLEWNGQKHLIFISTISESSSLQWKSQLEVLNLTSGKFGYPLRLPHRRAKTLFQFQLIDSLHLVVVPGPGAQFLNIYKLSNKRMTLVSRLSMQQIFTSVEYVHRLAFDVIKSQNVLVIGCNKQLKLFNIHSKKIIYEIKADNTQDAYITGISFMESQNLLAVGKHSDQLLIYSIVNVRNSLRFEHCIKLGSSIYNYELMDVFSHTGLFIVPQILSIIVLHRIQFLFKEIKQDHFDTQITHAYEDYVTIATTSNLSLLTYSIMSTTVDNVSCAGLGRLRVSKDKLDKVSLFKGGSMMVLFDSKEMKVNYNTQNNSIFILAKANDGKSSYAERYFRQQCKPIVKKIPRMSKANATYEEITWILPYDLQKLITIFEELLLIIDDNGTDSLDTFLDELWSIFKTLFKTFSKVDQIISKLCRLAQRFMRVVQINFMPYASDYFEIIQKGFPVLPLPEFLYSLETSVRMFGDSSEMTELLTNTYELVSEKVLQLSKEKDVKYRHKLNETFFVLMFIYIKHFPFIILSSETFERSLQFVESMTGTDRVDILRPLCMLIESLFLLTNENPQNEVEKIATDVLLRYYGGTYIKSFILQLMQYSLQKYSSQEEKDCIYKVIFTSFTRMKKQTIGWIKEALEEDSKNIFCKSQREDILRNLNKIDVSNLKLGHAGEEKLDDLGIISQKFNKVFGIFDY